MNETTENFLKVMSEFAWPADRPISYRLYYNPDGTPKCYTMDDLPGKYIEVDKETYIAHLWNVRVVDNRLCVIPIKQKISKLKPSTDEGVVCHPKDVCVIAVDNQAGIKWKTVQNEVD